MNEPITHTDGFSDILAQRFSWIAPSVLTFFGTMVTSSIAALGIYFNRRSDTNKENENQSEKIPLNEVENNEVRDASSVHIDINDCIVES